MPKLILEGLTYLLWIALGAGMAFMTFSMLAKSIENLDPNSKNVKKTVGFIAVSRFLRLFVTAALLFGAVLWNVWYAVTFIVALTLATWILAVWHHKQSAKSAVKLVTESKVEENV